MATPLNLPLHVQVPIGVGVPYIAVGTYMVNVTIFRIGANNYRSAVAGQILGIGTATNRSIAAAGWNQGTFGQLGASSTMVVVNGETFQLAIIDNFNNNLGSGWGVAAFACRLG